MNKLNIPCIEITRRTATALSKASPVKCDTDAEYVVTSTTSADKAILGVLAEDTVAEGTARVIVMGLAQVKIKTASGLAVGDFIMQSDTAGKAIECSGSAGTNYAAIGKCFVAPGADNDLVTCLISPSLFQA